MNTDSQTGGLCRAKAALGACGLITALLVSCASSGAAYRTRVEHQHDRFDGEVLSGRSVVLFPLMTDEGVDSTGALAYEKLKQRLAPIRPDLRFCAPSDFERAYAAQHEYESLDSFYADIRRERIVAVQTSDSVWASMPCDFAFIARIVEGARIRGFDGELTRRMSIEGELWRAETGEAVWRARAYAADNAAEADELFIARGYGALFRALPGFRPALNETKW